eukprot:m.350347 g.350347  ORF g.350347 m.350347 type:complete len:283 (+) comp46968_c0_seq1:151-999(+)
MEAPPTRSTLNTTNAMSLPDNLESDFSVDDFVSPDNLPNYEFQTLMLCQKLSPDKLSSQITLGESAFTGAIRAKPAMNDCPNPNYFIVGPPYQHVMPGDNEGDRYINELGGNSFNQGSQAKGRDDNLPLIGSFTDKSPNEEIVKVEQNDNNLNDRNEVSQIRKVCWSCLREHMDRYNIKEDLIKEKYLSNKLAEEFYHAHKNTCPAACHRSSKLKWRFRKRRVAQAQARKPRRTKRACYARSKHTKDGGWSVPQYKSIEGLLRKQRAIPTRIRNSDESLDYS